MRLVRVWVVLVGVLPARLLAEVITQVGPSSIQKAIAFGESAGDGARLAVFFGSIDTLVKGKGGGGAIDVTTPLCRIARAAADAKRKYKTFGPADVTPAMTAAVAEATVDPLLMSREFTGDLVNVEHVVLAHRDAQDQLVTVQPTSLRPFTKTFENRLGMRREGRGMVATFPLSALKDFSELRVLYHGGHELSFPGREVEDCDADVRTRIAAMRQARNDAGRKEAEESGEAGAAVVRAETEKKAATEVARLIGELSSALPFDRAMAADKLAGLGAKASPAVSALIVALKDTDPVVRGSAVKALGAIGPAAQEAIPALEELAGDPALRFTVAAAIKLINAKLP